MSNYKNKGSLMNGPSSVHSRGYPPTLSEIRHSNLASQASTVPNNLEHMGRPSGSSVSPASVAHGEYSGVMNAGSNSALSQMHHSINPATNDAPLEFNMSKNNPLMPIMIGSNSVIDDSLHDEPIIIDEQRRDRPMRSKRERSRDRDYDRERSRNRDRERDKGRERLRDRIQKDSDSGSRRRSAFNSPTDNNMQSGTSQPIQESNQSNQGFGPMAPWGPMWGPMAAMGPIGGPISGPVGPIGGPVSGPVGPMGGPISGPVGPMGPIGPIGPINPMGNPMTQTNEVPPLSGEFRISWGMFGWVMSPDGVTVPVKNPLHCKTCILVPPNRLVPPPTTRERPTGCRTVFVGGLPENVTEEIIRDLFERCGEITTVRLSKKNFCHIRYELEDFVDNAIYLSGYRMRINNSTDACNTGRLHVDYAQARDDQYEWECRQRQLKREQRHRERVEAERRRPPSPPPVVHFSDHESSVISDQLKVDDSFAKAAQILITWLERGDCSKRNAGAFYSMIQSTNSHVRRLISEKNQYEEELAKFREQTRARMQGVVMQFGQIERVFTSASHQKVWDHFTKAQRRNIEMWKKQAQEIKQMQLDESDKEDAEEMDVSDEDGTSNSAGRMITFSATATDYLKEENDSLRCQMEAYKNEVDLVKADLKSEVAQKDDQIQVLKKTLQGMQQTLTENATRRKIEEVKLNELQEQIRKSNDSEEVSCSDHRESSPTAPIAEKPAWLIGLISTFLHIHPKGASVDYIWSYIHQFDKEMRSTEIENLLNQYASVFKQVTTGVGACLERKWVFIGFNKYKE